MNITQKVIQGRLGLAVERCHTIRHTGSYTNGHHTANMLLLAWHLYREDFPVLAPVILAHDIPEAWVGDIPAPLLREAPMVKEQVLSIEDTILKSLDLPSEFILATPELYLKFKACDRLEFLLWCLEQKAMGNNHVDECIKELSTLLTAENLPGEAFLFFQRLKSPGAILPRQAGVIKESV